MLEVLFIGLSLGSILLLVALGLAITYGAMGVINMAHGEMVMIGAYVTVLSGLWLCANIFVAIPLAFIVTALIGLLIERVVVRRLYGRLLDTLLATWGIAILIQQAVRTQTARAMRRDGKSFGQIAKEEVNPVAGLAAMVAIFAIMIILLAVLALVVVNALRDSPWGLFTLSMTIPIALLMGWWMNNIRPGKVAEATVIGIGLLLLALVGGQWVSQHPTWGP